MINAFYEPLTFELPLLRVKNKWYRVIDTNMASPEDYSDPENASEVNDNEYTLERNSIVVLMAQ